MPKKRSGFMSLLIVFCLTGCTDYAEKLGFSQAQWSQLSPMQKQYQIEHYEALQAAVQHPLPVLSDPKRPIRVALLSGKASFGMAQVLLPLLPQHWQLKPGRCHRVTLRAQDTDATRLMHTCYLKGVLRIRLRRKGPVLMLPHALVWRQGLVYEGLHLGGSPQVRDLRLDVHEQ